MTIGSNDTPYVIVIDGNTIWHRQFGRALLRDCPGKIILPYSSFEAKARVKAVDLDRETSFGLPPGWASSTALVGQNLLGKYALLLARNARRPAVAVITSPAYGYVARQLSGKLPYAYYCADDYRQYQGWGRRVASKEASILCGAELGIFVSEALRKRAQETLGLPPERAIVSPNATEPRFIYNHAMDLPEEIALLPRPIVGVLGEISARLDIESLYSLAERMRHGTLLIAGRIAEDAGELGRRLSALSRVHTTGTLPHESMHLYAGAMDIGFIPYIRSALNFHCSPMRLYDHLATGARVFATDACDQINRYRDEAVRVGSAQAIVPLILAEMRRIVGEGGRKRNCVNELWSDRAAIVIPRLAAIARHAH